jgi:hypothetical protein
VIFAGVDLRRAALVATLAAGGALVLLSSASAASDVRVTAIDCLSHPRRIAFQNTGDAAQDLAGWKLLSNKPNEVFDLSVAASVEPGAVFYVFNGHLAPPAPEQSGGQWIYPWNHTPVLDESAFVLKEDGTDFIRLIDASSFPWRDVSHMPCPDNTTAIPPLEQPATPTPPPSNPDPDAGGNTGQTDGNQATSAQTDGAQSTGASQNAAASGNTAATSGAGAAAQPGSVSGAAGGPASGVGALPLQISSGQPFGSHLLPLSLLGVVAGVALSLVGLRMLSRALRRP